MPLAALAFVACARGSASQQTPTAPAATPTSSAPDLAVFRGFIYPIKGACLPKGDQLMPGALRQYRDGTHEGIDFYDVDNCTKIEKGTPVLAAKDGTVIRADLGYQDLTQRELDDLNAKVAAGQANDPSVLDAFRGRQVWVDHGHGIVTRYAHLSGMAPGVTVGAKVAQGETIAFVGDSGTPESVSDPTSEMHLHFELRVGETYLGAGKAADEVRALYENVFTPLPSP